MVDTTNYGTADDNKSAFESVPISTSENEGKKLLHEEKLNL